MYKTHIKKRVDIASEDFDELFDTIEDEKNLIDMYKPREKEDETGIIHEEERLNTEMLFMTGSEIAERYKEEIEKDGAVDYVKEVGGSGDELGRFGTYIVAIIMVVGFIYFIYKIVSVVR